MTLTKATLTEKFAEEDGFTKNRATDIVESFLAIIKSTLESGGNVLVSGFGKFYVNEKSERKGRNPATGKAFMLPARKVLTFKYSGKLMDKVI